MPKDSSIKSILIIGSGPIVIGQACEFDYAGSQASRSLRDEGIEVTLINSNPATIMTDKVVADNVYLKPLEPSSVREILEQHKYTKSKLLTSKIGFGNYAATSGMHRPGCENSEFRFKRILKWCDIT